MEKIEVCYRVDKILKKSNSAVWGAFKVGDLMFIELELSRYKRGVSVKRKTPDSYDFMDLGESSWAIAARTLRENFELSKVDDKMSDHIEEYCKYHCLTSGCPEICEDCPLKN